MSTESLPREFGAFQLLRLLGTGAFGTVYEARNRVEDRLVALKVLKGEFKPDEEAWQRFEKEAQAAALVTHPNCVFVYAAHLVDGVPAIEMELATGGTLQQRIDSGEAVPIEQSLVLACELLDGIEGAHRAGVLHRDIKPTNCFLTEDGHLKVGDFGLSRLFRGDPNLTGIGRFLGTPLFASPEQVRGETLDARSDVYSAATTIYNLIGGVPPFLARSYEECIGKVLTQVPVPLEQLRTDLPKGLSAVLLRAMDKDPRKRPASCAALKASIEAFHIGRAQLVPAGARLLAGVIDFLLFTMMLVLVDVQWPDLQIVKHENGLLQRCVECICAIALYVVPTAGIGASPGQWLTGLRVVAADGGRASIAQLLLRTACYPGVTIAIVTGIYWLGRLVGIDLEDPTWLNSVTLPISLAAFLLPALSYRRGTPFVAWHERVSRTRTLSRSPTPPVGGFTPRSTPPRTSEPGDTILGPWLDKGILGTTPHGVLRLCRDPQLGREVWVHDQEPAGPSTAGSSVRAGPTTLRFLSSIELTRRYDVYECPGGASLRSYEHAGQPVPWHAARRILLDLVDHLEQASATPDFDQLWLDANGRLRVLEFRYYAYSNAVSTAEVLSPLELLRKVCAVLTTSEVVFEWPQGKRVAVTKHRLRSLPMHAERPVANLLQPDAGGQSLATIRTTLTALQNRRTEVTNGMRRRQLPLALAVPVLLFFLVRPWQETRTTVLATLEVMASKADARNEPLQFEVKPRTIVPINALRRDALRVQLAAAAAGGWTSGDQDLDAAAAAAVRSHPAIRGVDLLEARYRLEPLEPVLAALAEGGAAGQWWWLAKLLTLGAAFSAAVALLFGIQPSWALVGAAVRGANARPVTRVRAMARAIITWSPWLVLAAAFAMLHEAHSQVPGVHASGPETGLYTLVKLALWGLVKALPHLAAILLVVAVAVRNQLSTLISSFGLRRSKPNDAAEHDHDGVADRLAQTTIIAR